MDRQEIIKLKFGSKELWNAVKRKLSEANITPQIANNELQDCTDKHGYIRPNYGNIHLILDLLEISMSDLVFEELNMESLTPDQEKMLKMFSTVAIKDQQTLLNILLDLTGNKFYNLKHNPKVRLRFYLEHSKFDCLPFIAQYFQLPKSEIKESSAAEWFIGNFKRVEFSGITVSMEEIIQISAILNISPRWLSGFNEGSSFWGYTPLTESLFDQWSVAQQPSKSIIEDILKSFRLE